MHLLVVASSMINTQPWQKNLWIYWISGFFSIQRLLHIYCEMLLFAFPAERTIIYSCTTTTWRIGVSIVIWGFTPYVCRRILFVVPWQIVFVAVRHWNVTACKHWIWMKQRYRQTRHGYDNRQPLICYWNSPPKHESPKHVIICCLGILKD